MYCVPLLPTPLCFLPACYQGSALCAFFSVPTVDHLCVCFCNSPVVSACLCVAKPAPGMLLSGLFARLWELAGVAYAFNSVLYTIHKCCLLECHLGQSCPKTCKLCLINACLACRLETGAWSLTTGAFTKGWMLLVCPALPTMSPVPMELQTWLVTWQLPLQLLP